MSRIERLKLRQASAHEKVSNDPAMYLSVEEICSFACQWISIPRLIIIIKIKIAIIPSRPCKAVRWA